MYKWLKNSLLFFLLMILISSCDDSGDQFFFQKQKKISFFREKEKAISKIYEGYNYGKVTEEYSSDSADLDHALFSLRNEINGIPLKTKYFFDAKDSIVRFIVYEWNIATPEMDQNEVNELMQNNLNFHKEYVEKFNEIAQKLESELGKPTQGDGILHKEKFQNIERNYAEYVWQKNKQTVELTMSLIPTMSYRIFVKTYWQ